MKTAVIIVAGGTGTRMGTETPKQFLPLAGRPLLMHTIARFYEALPEADRIVVLPEAERSRWEALCREHGFTVGHRVVAGGATRFGSVKNGLDAVEECDYVGVHDGVRPLVPVEVIRRTWEAAQDLGAAIPVVPVADSLREMEVCAHECENPDEATGSRPVDRSRLVAVQTPQFFRGPVLRRAYEQAVRQDFTDDASVVEAAGYSVSLTAGDPVNIKVTTPFDLDIAETVLRGH